MTAILSYLLDGGVFLAADSGLSLEEGHEGMLPDDKINPVNDHTATVFTGFVASGLAVTESLIDEVGDDLHHQEVIGLAEKSVKEAYKQSLEQYSHIESQALRFVYVLAGRCPVEGHGYLAVIDTNKTRSADKFEAQVHASPGFRFSTGTDIDMIDTISEAIVSRLSQSYDRIPLDLWASETVGELSKRSDHIDLPVQLVKISSEEGWQSDKYRSVNQKPNSPFQTDADT